MGGTEETEILCYSLQRSWSENFAPLVIFLIHINTVFVRGSFSTWGPVIIVHALISCQCIELSSVIVIVDSVSFLRGFSLNKLKPSDSNLILTIALVLSFLP